MTPTPFHDWLHTLPPEQVRMLGRLRRAARDAYPDDANYLATALDSGPAGLVALVTAAEVATLSAMPRAFVLMVGAPGA